MTFFSNISKTTISLKKGISEKNWECFNQLLLKFNNQSTCNRKRPKFCQDQDLKNCFFFCTSLTYLPYKAGENKVFEEIILSINLAQIQIYIIPFFSIFKFKQSCQFVSLFATVVFFQGSTFYI